MKSLLLLAFLLAVLSLVVARFPIAYVDRKSVDVFRLLSAMRNNLQKKDVWRQLEDYDYQIA